MFSSERSPDFAKASFTHPLYKWKIYLWSCCMELKVVKFETILEILNKSKKLQWAISSPLSRNKNYLGCSSAFWMYGNIISSWRLPRPPSSSIHWLYSELKGNWSSCFITWSGITGEVAMSGYIVYLMKFGTFRLIACS